MTRCVTCMCWFVLLIPAGCRTQPYVNAHIESVNAEYRELEDYVYCLEDENARLAQELKAAKRGAGPATLAPSGSGGGIFRRRPAGSSSEELTPPRIEANPATEVPMIEIPGGGSPTPPPTSRSELTPKEGEGEIATVSAKPTDTKVTHLFLNPLLTGGADFDGQSGDDGLAVVLEPRNAQDEYVPQAGPVSVVVLDPARQGDAARVARWDFDLSTARQMLAAASPARGIKLELPWPAAPPANSHLKVFVRYETPDGRKLTTDRDVHLAAAGEVSTGWTPRTAAVTSPPPEEPSKALPLEVASLPAPPATLDDQPKPAAPLTPPPALSADARPPAARAAWSPNR